MTYLTPFTLETLQSMYPHLDISQMLASTQADATMYINYMKSFMPLGADKVLSDIPGTKMWCINEHLTWYVSRTEAPIRWFLVSEAIYSVNSAGSFNELTPQAVAVIKAEGFKDYYDSESSQPCSEFWDNNPIGFSYNIGRFVRYKPKMRKFLELRQAYYNTKIATNLLSELNGRKVWIKKN